MKKRLLKIGAIVLGVALVLGLILPGMVAAQPDPEPQVQPSSLPNIVRGEVISIAQDGKSFVIQTGDEEEVTINVDDNSRYYTARLPFFPGSGSVSPRSCEPERIREQMRPYKGNLKDIQRGLGLKNGPGQASAVEDYDLDADYNLGDINLDEGSGNWFGWWGRGWQGGIQGSFADIALGDTVIVHLMPNESLAKQVLIIKGSVIAQVKGTISVLGTNSITITKSDSSTVVLSWDENTRFVLKGVLSVQVGQTATAVYNADSKLAKVVSIRVPAAAAETTSSVST